MTEEMRQRFMEELVGKKVDEVEWCDDAFGYYVIKFTDGTELCVTLMVDAIA